MSIEFRMTMDCHAREIVRDGQLVGSVQWHTCRDPRIVMLPDFHLTLNEAMACVKELDRVRRKS